VVIHTTVAEGRELGRVLPALFGRESPRSRTFAHQFNAIDSRRSFITLEQWRKDLAWDISAFRMRRAERPLLSEDAVQRLPDRYCTATKTGPVADNQLFAVERRKPTSLVVARGKGSLKDASYFTPAAHTQAQ
jgi:hypothetical protein